MGVIDEVWNSIFTNQYKVSVIEKHLNKVIMLLLCLVPRKY